MGWDIYMYAEVKENGQWRLADPPRESPFLGKVAAVEEIDLDEIDLTIDGLAPSTPRCEPQSILLGRCSPLFAILGDLQVDDSNAEPYLTLTPHRGVPLDASPELQQWYEYVCTDASGESWMYLEEFLGFDWAEHIVQREAMVDPRAAHLFTENPLGFPWERWPEGVEISHATWLRDGMTVRWRETYAQAANHAYVKERLLPYGVDRAPHAVRFVFWFSY